MFFYIANTFRTISFSLTNSNDFLWSYLFVQSNILLSRPIYFQEPYEKETEPTLRNLSILPFWCQDSNDYAIFIYIAFQFDLYIYLITWKVFSNSRPFLSSVFLNQLNKVCIFLICPRFFFPCIKLWNTFWVIVCIIISRRVTIRIP